jgi:hypothetical protein
MRLLILIILTLFLTACKTTQLAVVKQNDKYGFIDRNGKIITAPVWDFILQGYNSTKMGLHKLKRRYSNSISV